MGYNVQKGFGLTNNQREIILANIVENTNITKHEISSHIQRCINQHKKQQNYKDAVQCWQHDYEFVSNYKHGDLPEVIIEKIKMEDNQPRCPKCGSTSIATVNKGYSFGLDF